MKRFLLGLALLGLASSAFAEGGTPTNPLYVREQQGTTRTYAEVSCTTAGDVALVAATATANARSILFTNESTTDTVTICPVAAAAGVCDSVTKGFHLWTKSSVPFNRSVRDTAWSCRATAAGDCIGAGDPAPCCTGAGAGATCGTTIIGVLIEK